MERRHSIREFETMSKQLIGDDSSTYSGRSNNTTFDRNSRKNYEQQQQRLSSTAFPNSRVPQSMQSSSRSLDSRSFVENPGSKDGSRSLLDMQDSSYGIEYERENESLSGPQHHNSPQLILKPAVKGRMSNDSHIHQSTNLEASSVISDASGHIYINSTKSVVNKIFRVAQNRKKNQQLSAQTTDTTSKVDDNKTSAVTFARDSTKAGFLHKLGTNVQQYKRRFFVLKPSTYLYYFLSPNDTEPRGCIDLQGTTLKEVQKLPDGRYRFEIQIQSTQLEKDPSSTKSNYQSIVLEARNEEIGLEWITSLTEERLPYCKEQMNIQQNQIQTLRSKVDSLKKQLEDFRLVEKDRDGAIQDANEWKNKFNNLNEAITLLTRQIKTRREDRPNDDKNDKSNFAFLTEEQKKLDAINTAGSNFPPLHNACEMLLENIQLITLEADAIAKDLQNSASSVKAAEKKMSKAEKLVCKLWEENCAMRDTIKQMKKEKKVLVNEVKSLINTVEQKDSLIQDMDAKGHNGEETRLIHELEEHLATTLRLHEQFRAANASTNIKSSTIVKSNLGKPQPISDTTLKLPLQSTAIEENDEGKLKVEENPKNEQMQSHDSSTESSQYSPSDGNNSVLNTTLSPLRPTRLVLPSKTIDKGTLAPAVSSLTNSSYDGLVSKKSLYEDDSSNGGEDGSDSEKEFPIQTDEVYPIINNDKRKGTSLEQNKNQNRIIENSMTINANEEDEENIFSGNTSNRKRNNHILPHLINISEEESQSVSSASTGRINPLIELNADDDCTSEQSITKSIITDNGQATSKLVCPLNDVKDLEAPDVMTDKREHGEVYHLTFCK